MSFSTCDKCGGNIQLGPDESNLCESCGRALFSGPARRDEAITDEMVEVARLAHMKKQHEQNLDVKDLLLYRDEEERAIRSDSRARARMRAVLESVSIAALAERDQLKKDLEIARAERNRAGVEAARKYQPAVKAFQFLRTIMDNATIYEQPEDGTRQWCPDLNIYLRGGVGMMVQITKEEKAQIDKLLLSYYEGEEIHGYEGEGGSVGWCPHCDGRGKTGPTPDSAVPCDECGGNGKWKFPPCNVAMAELRDKFGHLFNIKDES